MNTFALIPWDQSFLPALKDLLLQKGGASLGRCVVIFPHDRPRRYLTELFRKDSTIPRPLLLPRMQTLQECISLCRACSEQTQLHTAGMLDRVALLHGCVRQLGQDDPALCTYFADMDMATFFPWGIRLAALLEEIFLQRVEAQGLPYTEGEVSPTATALLNSLGRIRESYAAALRQRQWTTPGMDAWIVAQHPDRLPPQYVPGVAQQVFLAGFTALTQAEDTLLHHLWELGATVCLHSDPAIMENRGHWSCEDHRHWLQRWQAACTLLVPSSGHKPHLLFSAGYDIHSQLALLQKKLQDPMQDDDVISSTAVVLPAVDLLIPTLHHLPKSDVNISMGYPLSRSSIYRLLDAIFRLQATRQQDGRYHWKELLHCLRHPFLKMLHPLEETSQQDWTALLRTLENSLRSGTPFIQPEQLLTIPSLPSTPALNALLHQTISLLTDTFATCRTPGELADALAQLCALLLDYGHDALQHHPLDAESLFRLMRRIIPPLRDAEAANELFPQTALFSLVRQLIEAERVPFEADPLVGLQVLGMLETRLLHFRRVFLLNCVDDVLPGATPQDALLPDALRPLLGLPDNSQRERLMAHTFFRLCAGADEVHFFWQEGVQRSALFDGKKNRSRFVDELIWHEEQRRNKLLVPGEEPLFTAPCIVTPMPRQRRSLPMTEALRKKLRKLRAVPWAPTKLDRYLGCPLRFAFQYLYQLKPLQEVSEGDDPAAVGTLLHTVLHDAYTPFLGHTLHGDELSQDQLEEIFTEALHRSPLQTSLTPDGRIMLELSGKRALRNYLERQPSPTCILHLEWKLHTDITLPGHVPYRLEGTLDRVDQRDGSLYVLDYKTGSLPVIDTDIWEDSRFWNQLRAWLPTDQTLGMSLYQELSERLPSIQLPCYMLLCAHNETLPVRNAAWVPLRDDGKEQTLLPEDVDATRLKQLLSEDIPLLPDFLLHHMESQTAFIPRESNACAWCPYTDLCLQ